MAAQQIKRCAVELGTSLATLGFLVACFRYRHQLMRLFRMLVG